MLRGPYVYPTACERWLQDTGHAPPEDWDYTTKFRGESRETRISRERALKLLQRRFPGKRVNEFTAADLVDYLSKSRGPDGKLWAANTVNTRMAVLVAFFTWAADEEVGLIERNPANNLSKKMKRSGSAQRAAKINNWLTGEEVRALLASCDPGDPVQVRNRVVLELLVNTGLRVSEASGLRWSDVNLFAGQFSLVGKGGKAATLPISEPLAEVLRAWRARYVANLGAEPLHHPVLVGARNVIYQGVQLRWGAPCGHDAIWTVVRRHGILIGRPTLAPHDLRRTFAGLLEINGVPMQEICWRLRHSSVATTETYLKGNPLRFNNAASLRALY